MNCGNKLIYSHSSFIATVCLFHSWYALSRFDILNTISQYWLLWNKVLCPIVQPTHFGFHSFSCRIQFFEPTRSRILYLASPCYASLRSVPQDCFALYKILELVGSKNWILHLNKWKPQFVAHTMEQRTIVTLYGTLFNFIFYYRKNQNEKSLYTKHHI